MALKNSQWFEKLVGEELKWTLEAYSRSLFNEIPRYEDVLGEWKYSSMYS